MGNKDDFKGIKHFGLEILSAVINALLKNNNTAATQIDFSYTNEKFDWNLAEASLKSGFSRPW